MDRECCVCAVFPLAVGGECVHLFRAFAALQCVAHVEAFIDFSEDENIEDDVIAGGGPIGLPARLWGLTPCKRAGAYTVGPVLIA